MAIKYNVRTYSDIHYIDIHTIQIVMYNLIIVFHPTMDRR